MSWPQQLIDRVAAMDAEIAALKAKIEFLQQKRNRIVDAQMLNDLDAALSCDVALAEFLRGKIDAGAPITRAASYNNNVDYRQELRAYTQVSRGGRGDDPRRPVLMRAACGLLQSKWRSDGWRHGVIDRYLRISKFTCTDKREMKEAIRKLDNQLRYSHKGTCWRWWMMGGTGCRKAVWEAPMRPDSNELLPDYGDEFVWVDGKRVWLIEKRQHIIEPHETALNAWKRRDDPDTITRAEVEEKRRAIQAEVDGRATMARLKKARKSAIDIRNKSGPGPVMSEDTLRMQAAMQRLQEHIHGSQDKRADRPAE